MEVILEKLANFPIGTLYGYCMDFWVEIDYFPKMEIVQVFQTWIFFFIPIWIFKIPNLDFQNLGENIILGNK